MTLTYIRWRDANHGSDDIAPHEVGLVELEEVGWLFSEDEEQVTLSMERMQDDERGRLWLTIPKVNIVERRDREFSKAFPQRRAAKQQEPA